MNPRFSQLSPDCAYVAAGSGQVWLRPLTSALPQQRIDRLRPGIVFVPVVEVSKANPAVVTTAIPHKFVKDQGVTLDGNPSVSGTFRIIDCTATQFTIPVNNARAATGGQCFWSGGWGPYWKTQRSLIYNGGNLNDQPNYPGLTGTWEYHVETKQSTRLSATGYSEAAAGGGQWICTISGRSLRHPDGRIENGRFFGPCMNMRGEYGYLVQEGGPNGPMTLYWKGVPIRKGNIRTPDANEDGVGWIEGKDAFGFFGNGVEKLSIPASGSSFHRCLPFRVGSELWLMQSRVWPHFTHNEDELIVRPKTSTMGYYVLPKPLPSFEPDAGSSGTTIRVSYAHNGLQVEAVSTTTPRKDVSMAQDVPDEPTAPPVEPPVTSGPSGPTAPPVTSGPSGPTAPPVDEDKPDHNDPRHVAYKERTHAYFAQYKDLYGTDPEPFSYADYMSECDDFDIDSDEELATDRQEIPHMWWRRDACQALHDVYKEKTGLNRPWDADGAAWYHYCQVYYGYTKEQIREEHHDSAEWEEEHGEVSPIPPPIIPPPAGGVIKVPSVHRSDFLTLLLLDGTPATKGDVRYQKRSAEERKKVRDAIKDRGYTRLWIDVCKDNADEFESPETLVPVLKECHEDGIGMCLLIAPEDAPKMEAKYIKTGKYNGALEKALRVWKNYVTEVCIGVEASETWSNPNDILSVARTVRKVIAKPKVLSLHLNSGDLRPKGGGSNFWSQAKAAGITMFDYQAEHPAVEDGGGAFLADPNTIKSQCKAAVAAVDDNVGVRLHEYAYFGKNPSKAVITKVSKEGAVLGDKGLEVAGIDGICNGGPGYWPPTKPQPLPPGTEDDIDIKLVRFFTRTGADISSEIRRWPVDSVLTPKFEGDDYVYYAHSASRSWPATSGNVNANSWIIFRQGDVWKGYTNDYLRPGEPKKDWQKINQINEPPTGWEARKGETVYLMASRIARTGSYPNGKSRTQMVKVKCP